MAIITLPYPNMDFVPLDVLTADELDQIVANIEAINNAMIGAGSISNGAINTAKLADGAVATPKVADGAITTPKVDDGAITRAKIDWSSMARGTISSRTYASAGTDVQITIPTMPNANYNVFLEITEGGTAWTSLVWRIKTKTTTSFTVNVYNSAGYQTGNVAFDWLVIPA